MREQFVLRRAGQPNPTGRDMVVPRSFFERLANSPDGVAFSVTGRTPSSVIIEMEDSGPVKGKAPVCEPLIIDVNENAYNSSEGEVTGSQARTKSNIP